ncbi:MAG TPA: hypothetical protein VKC60_06165 [Opitutaceae bacterium]|nr:hypothetical protein [Opitutaceae bacterium]
MSEIPDEYRAPDQKDLNRLIQYLAAAVSDPIRVSVLLAHGLIEELIDEFIKELVPNHDFLDLPKTGFSDKLRWARRLDCEGRDEPFWKFIASFNELRNAAAHRNWNEKRVEWAPTPDCY